MKISTTSELNFFIVAHMNIIHSTISAKQVKQLEVLQNTWARILSAAHVTMWVNNKSMEYGSECKDVM